MWPLATLSQEPNRVHHLAVLLNGAPDDAGAKPRLDAFLEALKDLGWIEGKNLQVDVRCLFGRTRYRPRSRWDWPCRRVYSPAPTRWSN